MQKKHLTNLMYITDKILRKLWIKEIFLNLVSASTKNRAITILKDKQQQQHIFSPKVKKGKDSCSDHVYTT